MRLHPPLTAVAAVAALSVAWPAAASASVDRFFDHPKGALGAPTELSSTDGCLDRTASVFPFLDPDGAAAVAAEVGVFDHCTGAPVLEHFGFAELGPGELTISDDRRTASLHASIPAFDGLAENEPATDPIEVDLTWEGAGRIHRSQVRYQNGTADGVTIVNHDKEACRDATVAGTVLSGGTDYAAGAVADALLCLQTAGSMFLFIGHP